MEEKVILREFLGEWLAWAIVGAVDADQGGEFHRSMGLCSNLEFWLDGKELDWEEAVPIYKLFKNLLNDYNQDDPTFPFGGERVYAEEQKLETMHLNPERIHWVANTINKLEEE